jgi:hypothetical protein
MKSMIVSMWVMTPDRPAFQLTAGRQPPRGDDHEGHEPESRIESIINGFHDRLHGVASCGDRGDHLSLPHATVLQMFVEHRGRIVDFWAVRRQQCPRAQGNQSLERDQIAAEIAAPAPVNHDAPTR